MADAGALPAPARRLHPWSWLFVLIAQLKSFAVPLLAVLVFGSRGDDYWQWELWGGLAGGLLALASVLQYFTYRYGVIGGELVIRSGLLQRNTRSIPLARIRNISLHRTLLHRLFGVAEVRLESAGGTGAEAQMRVLSLGAAAELERLLHQHGEAQASADAAPAGDTLLALDTAEVVRLGLISNRGMVVVAAGFGALWQLAPGDAGDWIAAFGDWLFGRASALQLGMIATAAALALLALLAVALLRLLSVALALLQFHGFRLARANGTLSVETGLLTRVRAHAPLAKVQFWTVTETLLHRLLGRQSVEVETAVSAGEQQQQSARALHHLVPVATPATVERLLDGLLPQARWPQFGWQPLHARAWRRMAFWPVVSTLLAALLLGVFGTPLALVLLLLLPVWAWRARGLARRSGFALDAGVVAWRSGWLDRRVSFAEIAKLQGVQLLQSPFDRRRGMASVVVDTAGAGAFGHRIHMRYLPEAVARRVAAELAGRIARSPLAW